MCAQRQRSRPHRWTISSLIRDGRTDIAFTMADTLSDAVKGKGAFEGQPVPIVALATLYTNYTYLVTMEGTGISDIAEPQGSSVVSLGSPGSGGEVSAERLLRAADSIPVAISPVMGSVSASRSEP